MARPKVHDEALRVRLLDEAGRLLSAEGPDALSLRRLAAVVGTSTSAVYSLFGGKPELLGALYVEAFRRFGARLAAVTPTDDPFEDLVRLGLAYRESALADPHLYSVMFGQAVPDFEPDDDALAVSAATVRPLLDLVEHANKAGILLPGAETEAVALTLWGVVHGLVSLELAGCLPPDLEVASTFEPSARAALRGWLRDPGSA